MKRKKERHKHGYYVAYREKIEQNAQPAESTPAEIQLRREDETPGRAVLGKQEETT